MHAITSLLIWDAAGAPPTGDYTKLLWRSYDIGGCNDVVSIPRQIEDNADKLRARYLAWIYELGETKIRGKRLVDQLGLRPGFSYWWMTLFAEKCNYAKSTQIDDAIRLIAFDDWATSRSISHVVLVSANQPLVECIRLWCVNLGVEFELLRKVKAPVRLSLVKRIYQAAPHTLQALAWLSRHLIDRWPLRGVGLREWQQSNGRVTFFSYLFNLSPDAALKGCYESRYWGHLPDALHHDNCQTNWLHLYMKDALLPTSKQAANMVRSFNTTGRGVQHHVTLDTFLTLMVAFRTLRDWMQILIVGVNLSRELSSKQGTSLNLWPLFEVDWRQSMCGTVAMSNLLNFNLFEFALKCLPQQRCGVYLQENQGWEFGLIHAWQATGHGRLIGTPHSTVRFWDLRYFFDPRSYYRSGIHDMPMPARVTFNGPALLDAFKNGGYPTDDLVEVEALRYLHLTNAKTEASSSLASKKGAIRLLVFGEYLLSNTKRQMSLLVQALILLPATFVITVKPHPACPICPADYPSLSMAVTTDSIAKLLAECDVAYSSSVTSAAVDAYCAGVPVVSFLDPNTLNLSPLRGCVGALFASSPEELGAALISAVLVPSTTDDHQDFFTLDPQLPRWRKLLQAVD